MKKIIENLFELQTLEFSDATNDTSEERIAQLRAEIPAQVPGHYDRLLARVRKGVAILRGQVCGACNMQVPRNTILTLMNGADIQICESCGRYLCLPEHAAVVQLSKAALQPA